MADAVDIALATFNGARFIGKQLESLARQTLPPAHVLVGEDGSEDDTPALIEAFFATNVLPHTVALDGPHLGAVRNFDRLLRRTRSPYVALCDQDDVWHPTKTARMLATMQRGEAAHGRATPLLVCCDLRLIDERDRVIAPSFHRHQRYQPAVGSRFASLLVMNCFPGCAMLLNRALVDLVLPMPEAAVMHDWWIALTAAAAGRVLICPETLIDYRIHAGNTIGIPESGIRAFFRKAGRKPQDVRSALRAAVAQARVLEARLGGRLGPDARRMLTAFNLLPDRNWASRRWTLLRHGIRKHDALRNVALLLKC